MRRQLKPNKALGMQPLASHLTLNEGGKSQGKLADTRQQLHILSKQFYSSSPSLTGAELSMLKQLCPQAYVLYKNGARIAKKIKK